MPHKNWRKDVGGQQYKVTEKLKNGKTENVSEMDETQINNSVY